LSRPGELVTKLSNARVGLVESEKIGVDEADTHVTIVPYFTVHEGKMEEFKAVFPKFYEGVHHGTKECLYYNFAVHENKVMCREGYKSAAGALQHLADVKEPLDKALTLASVDLSVMGPEAELAKLREPLAPFSTKFWVTDASGTMKRNRFVSGSDTHVTIVPYFTVHEGKMEEFKAGFLKFYEGVKAGTAETLYYNFAVHDAQSMELGAGSHGPGEWDRKVMCREGYKSAAGALQHLADVKEPLDKALTLASVDLSVMGPEAELAKLREPLAPFSTKFWVTDAGGFIR